MNRQVVNPALGKMLYDPSLVLINSNEPEISGPIEIEYILHPGQIQIGMFIICCEGPTRDCSFQSEAYQVEAVQYPFIIVSSMRSAYRHTWDVRRYRPMLLKEDMVKFMLKEQATPEIIERQRIFVQRHLGRGSFSSRYDLAKIQASS